VFSVLLRKEFECRMQSGERPDLKDMRARFPQYALQIALTHKAVKAEHARVETERTSESASKPTDDQATQGEATEMESSPPGSSGTSVASPASGGGPPAGESMFVDGRYKKQEILGAGGMGAIWTAFDSRTRRSVAFKEIKTNKVTHQEYVSRFVNEAQITAQLEHPGIVPVHDVGWQPDGSPYYVMQLVSDETLARRIRKFHSLKVGHADRNLESTRLLREFINVCYSLDYAHDRGIIHRDLKPQNVMMGQHGETVIIDWGLAKPFRRNRPADGQTQRKTPEPGRSTGKAAERVPGESVDLDSYGPERTPTLVVPDGSNKDTELLDPIEREHATPTIDGAVMGTLDYMAPEQAQGRLDSLDHRADIFALGAILFEILTGEAWPRGRMTTAEKIVYVADGIVPLAREVNEDVPKPLEAICSKTLHQNIEDRYGSARELIDDLECWLADKPVSVYADPWTTRCRRWVSRNRSLVTGLLVAVVVSIGGLMLWGVVRSQQVTTSRQNAESLEREAVAAVEAHEFERALEKLAEGVGIVESVPQLNDLAGRLRSDSDRIRSINRKDQAVHSLVRRVAFVVDQSQNSSVSEGQRNFAAEARDLNEALTELDEKLTNLKGQLPQALSDEERAITHWVSELQTSRDHVGTAIDDIRQIAQAVSNFFEFLSKFDNVRFYGAHTLGRSRADAIQETRQQAGDVLQFLARKIVRDVAVTGQIESTSDAAEPNTLPSELATARRITLALVAPANSSDSEFLHYLDQDQRERLLISLFELFLLLSDAESASGIGGTDGEQTNAAESALAWLRVARDLQIPARSIPYREVQHLSVLRRNAELVAARAELRDLPPQSPMDRFLLGEAERAAGRFDDALPFYVDVLADEPHNFHARYFSGWCELQLERPAAALKEFTLCVDQRPGFPAPLLARGLAWLKLAEFERSLSDIDLALEQDRDLYIGWMARGIAYSEQGRHAEALPSFDKAAVLRPENAWPLINRGETRRQLAIAILQKRDPSQTNDATRQLQEAIRDLSKATELDPRNARAYLFRGETLATLGQTGPALRDLQQGIVLGGQREFVIACYREIGRVQQQSGDFEAALWSFSRALEFNPDDPELLRLKGESLKKLGRDEDFIASLSRYLDVGQPLGEVFWERGLAHQRQRLLREAMQDFTRLLDSDASDYRTEALNRRGWMYLMHAHQFAEQDFDEAIRKQPANPDHYNGRGFARVLRGEYVAATSDAELAVKRIRVEDAQRGVAVWALYFNAATIYGQAVSRVENDLELSDAERAEYLEAYSSRAIALLDLARESADSKLHGRIAQAIQLEPSFESIRDTDTFGEMVKRLSTP